MVFATKLIVVFLLILIFFFLGSAFVYLIRGNNSEQIVKALTWRIGLSILLFIFLMIAFAMGWLTPHAI